MMACIYVVCFVVANLLLAHFGPSIAPINAFALVGLGLVARDLQHDKWQGEFFWIKMTGLIIAAGAISTLVNPAAGKIALASFCAVVAMGLFDSAVYSAMKNYPFLMRSNISNAIGAMLDSLVFFTVAFGFSLMPILMMTVAKIAGGFFWSVIAHKIFKRLSVLLFVFVAHESIAQNIQAHYDLDRELMTYTYESFVPTPRGNWFGFVDADYDDAMQQIYGELSYTAPIGFTVEANAGINEYWNDAVGLIGWQYKFARLLWRTDGNPQLTLVGNWNWERISVSGFADLWTEDGKTVFLAEPQLWVNVWGQLDIGGEVEVSHSFAGSDDWEVRPTIAMRLRW